MLRKLILVAGVFFGLIIFFSYSKVEASIFINEIMYDAEGADEGREWVEVYNAGQESVDLSEYKFWESSVNHKLTLTQGSGKIESQTYAVIVVDPVKFKTSWPNFSGSVFDSSFSLLNSGEVIAIKDKNLNVIDQAVYNARMGGAGNGRTISKINGVWIESRSTPGESNQIYISPPSPPSPPKLKPVPKPAPQTATADGGVPLEAGKPKVINEIIEVPIEKDQNSFIYFIILFFLLILGGGSAYFVRQKAKVSSAGEDFEVVEE